MTTEPLILCENLVKIYKLDEIEVIALQGLDLTVQPGEVMSLVGSSGSGKTTLLNVLGGLDRPAAGRLVVAGNDLLKMTDRDLDAYRRRYVGFVWQQKARNLIPYLNVEQNVELPMIMSSIAPRERRAWSSELIEAVRLGHRRHHRLAQLSGGEQQRVAVARALANRPKVVLADEPTGNLDEATADRVFDEFLHLVREEGSAALVATHNERLATRMDRVVRLHDGRIA
jgi:ABC-type lipoprotein export system ATPase subunit